MSEKQEHHSPDNQSMYSPTAQPGTPSERLLRLFLDNIPLGVFWKDRQSRYVGCNQIVARVFGLASPESMIGQDDHSLPGLTREQADLFIAHDRSVMEQNQPELEIIEQATLPDGSTIWMETNKVPVQDATGAVVGILGTWQDITARKQAEQGAAFRADIGLALVRADTLRSVLQQCAESMVRTFDAAFARIWTCNAGDDMLELQASAGLYTHLDGGHARIPVGQYKIGLIAQEKKPHLTNAVIGDPRVHDQEWAQREGMVAFAGYPLMVEERVVGVMAIFARHPLDEVVLGHLHQAATLIALFIERTQALASLQESEDRFRQLIEHAPEAVVILDMTTGRFIQVNPAAERLFKLTVGQLCQLGPSEVSPAQQPDGRPSSVCAAEHISRALTGETPVFEWMHCDSEGHTIPCEVRLLRMEFSGRTVVRGSVTDITERKRAEKALRESDDFLRMSQKVGKVGSWQWDLRTNQVRWSDAMYPIYGVAPGEFDGTIQNVVLRTHPDDLPAMQTIVESIIQGGEPRPMEARIVKPDGQIAFIWGFGEVVRDATGQPVQCVGTVMDITARKLAEDERHKLEAQIRHAQKLESLGVLAGGIAHDFNNLLTSILGYSDLALLELPPHSAARPFIAEAVSGARQAADLTRQMLAYSGKGRFVVESLNLNDVVEDMTHLLQVSISKKCVLKLHLMTDLPTIEADAVQMRQVIMNLIINASDAIGDRSGVIAITSGVMHCDRNYLADTFLDENLPDGLYVYLEVADTGSGMSAETRARIFDPFFSTKTTGRGLGLAAVLGIVRGHRGVLKVYSEVGKGTTFKVAFPAVDLPAHYRPTNTQPDETWRGSGTVLVVDDEEAVRSLAGRMLEIMGFTILSAIDGREGVELLRREGDKIRMVLLDMTMPHLDGAETFREMRRIHADVKVILTSGYNEQSAISQFAGKGLAGFIQKPYRYADLLTVVRKALDS